MRLTIKLLLILFFTASACFAGDPCVIRDMPTIQASSGIKEFRLTCTGDSGDGTVGDTTFSATNMAALFSGSGYILYMLETDPVGTVTAYSVEIEDAHGTTILQPGTNRSATLSEIVEGSYTLGIFPPITNAITVKVGNIGASNVTYIYLVFLAIR